MLDPKEILTSLSERFAATGEVQNVFGEPIEAHGKTIIPVARVQYGLGAGGGGENKVGSEDSTGGSGGGGGVGVRPVGVVEITDGGTRFIRFFDRAVAMRILAGGVMLGLILGRAMRGRK